MGQPAGHKRKHLRAPLTTEVVYVKGGQVLKGRLVNISEGGLLARYFPSLDLDEEIHALINIPEYPPFQNQSLEEVRQLHKENLPHRIFRVKLKASRKLVDPTSEESIPQNYVGLYFVSVSSEAQIFISTYVRAFAQNIIFLLKLLEGQRTQDIEDVRHMAKLLNYEDGLKVSLLRQKILHDYQSLQWI